MVSPTLCTLAHTDTQPRSRLTIRILSPAFLCDRCLPFNVDVSPKRSSCTDCDLPLADAGEFYVGDGGKALLCSIHFQARTAAQKLHQQKVREEQQKIREQLQQQQQLKCSKCDNPIPAGEGLQIGEPQANTYVHPTCFRCDSCGQALDGRCCMPDGPGGPMLCRGCFHRLSDYRCHRCKGRITTRADRPGEDPECCVVNIPGSRGDSIRSQAFFHVACFCCAACSCPFADGSAMIVGGEVFCPRHSRAPDTTESGANDGGGGASDEASPGIDGYESTAPGMCKTPPADLYGIPSPSAAALYGVPECHAATAVGSVPPTETISGIEVAMSAAANAGGEQCGWCLVA